MSSEPFQLLQRLRNATADKAETLEATTFTYLRALEDLISVNSDEDAELLRVSQGTAIQDFFRIRADMGVHNVSSDAVSDRRLKLRERCRDRWRGIETLDTSQLEQDLSSFFEPVVLTAKTEEQSTKLQKSLCKPGSQRKLVPLFKRKENQSPSRDMMDKSQFKHNAHTLGFQTAAERLEKEKSVGDDEGWKTEIKNSTRQPGSSSSEPRYHPMRSTFVSIRKDNEHSEEETVKVRKKFVSPVMKKDKKITSPQSAQKEDLDPRLKSCDPELVAKIELEIVDHGDPVAFDDIAGLEFAKRCIKELVIWPMARPDIFSGLRSLPKGLLLFGPPGTGKTLIGRAMASQCNATFFSISASSLTSKWIGEGEKLVRTLFAVAAVKQPSVIFIDEIDSLLTQRRSDENEASRRIKTEFLVQLDGTGTRKKDTVLVVGATNRPQELDDAARRRFVKRLYIPLPCLEARCQMVRHLLKDNKHELTPENIKHIAERTQGYSGADVGSLCTEAAMGPIRSCMDIQTMDANTVRSINLDDFDAAMRGVRSSVAASDLEFYRKWNEEFGSFPFEGNSN